MLDSRTIPEGITVDSGSFTGKDPMVGTFRYASTAKTFPDNWFKKDSENNSPFVMNIRCRNLLMVYKESRSSSFGAAEVFVDGQPAGSYCGYSGGGWNNPLTVILIDDDEVSDHTVEILMAEDEASKYFTIMAFGYTE